MSAAATSLFDTFSSQGFSDEARFVAEQKELGQLHWRSSYSLQGRLDEAFTELDELYTESCERGWDGYDAEPVSESTLRYGLEFLRVLPSDIAMPSVGAEPDGQITLEWYQSPRWVLSISISPDSELHYAALIGASKHYGSAPFTGVLPNPLLTLIKQLSPNG